MKRLLAKTLPCVVLLLQACGGTPDVVKVAQKKAALGDPEGQYNLGIAYLRGHGVEKDVSQGLALVEKSANQGFLSAQVSLATLYDTSERNQLQDSLKSLAPTDNVKACQWWQRASDNKDLATSAHAATILLHLSLCLAEGTGVPQDRVKAYTVAMTARDVFRLPADSMGPILKSVYSEMSPRERELIDSQLSKSGKAQ